MTCKHEEAEKDTAIFADGMCPLCLAAELADLRAENEALQEIKKAALAWRSYWPDENDRREAYEEACDCKICDLIRACDALAGDA